MLTVLRGGSSLNLAYVDDRCASPLAECEQSVFSGQQVRRGESGRVARPESRGAARAPEDLRHGCQLGRGQRDRLRLVAVDDLSDRLFDMEGAWPTAAEAPVVEGPDRNVEVLRQFLDAHQRLQAAESGCSGLHAH